MKKTKIVFVYLAPVLIFGGFLFYYFQSDTHYEARIPLDFIPYSKQPRAEVLIEGNKYPLMIDLGSPSSLTLKTEILDTIQKIPTGIVYSTDFKGNEYKSKTYLLPEIRIRNMIITKVETIDEGINFLKKGSVIYDDTGKNEKETTKEKPGRIGRKLFINGKANLLLDFHNSVMFACCHLKDRKKNGYQINQFVSAPFELSDAEGIVLSIDTDLGTQRFMLDTGTTRSLLNSSSSQCPDCEEWKPGLYQYQSLKFVFGGKDFGSQDFLLIEMAASFKNLDGVIGMDFLQNHVVYIDFDQKRIYLGKAEEVLSQN